MVGGGCYNSMNDLDVESGIPDFVVRSESPKNDLFSNSGCTIYMSHRGLKGKKQSTVPMPRDISEAS